MTPEAGRLLLHSDMQMWIKELENADEAMEEGDTWRARYCTLLVKTLIEMALRREEAPKP